jgi:hypothetical protein
MRVEEVGEDLLLADLHSQLVELEPHQRSSDVPSLRSSWARSKKIRFSTTLPFSTLIRSTPGCSIRSPLAFRRVSDPADEDVLAVVGGLPHAQRQVRDAPQQLLERADVLVTASHRLVATRPVADHVVVDGVRGGGEVGLRPELGEGIGGEAFPLSGGAHVHSFARDRLRSERRSRRAVAQLPRR